MFDHTKFLLDVEKCVFNWSLMFSMVIFQKSIVDMGPVWRSEWLLHRKEMRFLYFFPYPCTALNNVVLHLAVVHRGGRGVCSERDATQGNMTESEGT